MPNGYPVLVFARVSLEHSTIDTLRVHPSVTFHPLHAQPYEVCPVCEAQAISADLMPPTVIDWNGTHLRVRIYLCRSCEELFYNKTDWSPKNG